MWREQLHTLDRPPLLVMVEPILTRLEAGNDRMPCWKPVLETGVGNRVVVGNRGQPACFQGETGDSPHVSR
jgi:hypothetical protein